MPVAVNELLRSQRHLDSVTLDDNVPLLLAVSSYEALLHSAYPSSSAHDPQDPEPVGDLVSVTTAARRKVDVREMVVPDRSQVS